MTWTWRDRIEGAALLGLAFVFAVPLYLWGRYLEWRDEQEYGPPGDVPPWPDAQVVDW